MIIKSAFRTFGYWLTILCVFGGVFATIYFLATGYQNHLLGTLIFLFVIMSILFGTYGRLLYDSNILTIEALNETIKFTNQITRKSSTYPLSYFDGRIVCMEPIKGGYARNLYLVKDKRAIKKISDFVYSNHKEIEEALKTIPDLGTFEYSYRKSWRIYFRRPIL